MMMKFKLKMERRYKVSKLLIIISLVMLGSIWSYGQEEKYDTLNTSTTYEIDIQLDSADRNYQPAKVKKQSAVEEKELKYHAQDYKLKVGRLNPRIPIYPIRAQKPENLNGGVLKLGFGNYITPYVEVILNNTRDKNNSYGLHLLHHSSQNGLIDKENSGLSTNKIEFYGTNFTAKRYDLSGRLSYDRKGLRFYGYPDSLSGVLLGDIKRVVNSGVVDLKLKSKGNEKLQYSFGLGYDVLGDNYKMSENTVRSLVNIKYDLDSNSHIVFENKNYIGNVKDSLANTSRTYFGLKPYYSFYNPEKRMRTNIGINAVIENDSLSKKSVHVYPYVLLDYLLIKPPSLRVFIGMNGDMERNSLKGLFASNPYMSPVVNVTNANKTISFFAGLSTTLKKYFTVRLEGGFSNYKNQYFFVNNRLKQSEFISQVDTGNVTKSYLIGQLKYERKKINAGFGFEYNQWGTGSVRKAYHRPALQSDLFIRYQLNKKLKLGLNTYLYSGIKAYDIGDVKDVILPAYTDLSLNAVYQQNKKLSFWLEVNNIFAQQNQRYLYYPSQGVNALLGLTYKM